MRKYSYLLAYILHLSTWGDTGSFYFFWIFAIAVTSTLLSYIEQSKEDRYYIDKQIAAIAYVNIITQAVVFIGLAIFGKNYSAFNILFYLLWPLIQVLTLTIAPALSKKTKLLVS